MEENITNQEEQVINNIEEPMQEAEKCQCNDNKKCRCLPIVNCILLVGLILLYIFHFTGIGAKGGKGLANADAKAPVVVGEGGLKIAYVNTDSLNANYKYIKDLEKELNAFKQGKENSLKQQMDKLQADSKALQDDYQNYLQNGSSMSLTQQQNKEAELKKRDAEIKKRAQQLAQLEQDYTSQILEKQTSENKKMIDAVYAFIREYNAQNQQFNLILAKTGTELPFILYGDEAMDITDEIVKGLNEEYEKVNSNK
ncbi:MAG: OmpH family outer membrane protein [Bacteroidales bacterium]|nr:OmpH family outer membrane protein [Bacteroidales bacterium]